MAMEGSDDAGVPDNVRLVVSLVPALLRLVVNLIIFFPSEPGGEHAPLRWSQAVASWAPHTKYLRSDGDNCIGYLGRAYAKQPVTIGRPLLRIMRYFCARTLGPRRASELCTGSREN